jgi:hypothetical protein
MGARAEIGEDVSCAFWSALEALRWRFSLWQACGIGVHRSIVYIYSSLRW